MGNPDRVTSPGGGGVGAAGCGDAGDVFWGSGASGNSAELEKVFCAKRCVWKRRRAAKISGKDVLLGVTSIAAVHENWASVVRPLFRRLP